MLRKVKGKIAYMLGMVTGFCYMAPFLVVCILGRIAKEMNLVRLHIFCCRTARRYAISIRNRMHMHFGPMVDLGVCDHAVEAFDGFVYWI